MSENEKLIKCIFVGDIALGDHPKSVGFGFYSKYKKGIPIYKADTLFPKGIEADIIFGNLEFNIGNQDLSAGNFYHLNCRGISQYADFLEKAGFNVLNMANNHIFQHGREEFDRTAKLLSSKKISIAGLKDDQNLRNIVELDGQNVAFLAWSARPRQGFVCEPPYKEFNYYQSYSEIENAKTYADIICVSLHWGEEFIEMPKGEERIIARAMIDKGANIVIGHHPHVIREIEEYHGGLIAYSLGNFICDMTWSSSTANTGLLYVEFDEGRIIFWKWIPGKICEDFFPRYYESTKTEIFVGSSVRLRRLKEKLLFYSYEEVAKKALRKHQVLTLFHMIRNLHKFKLKILLRIIKNTLTSC